MEGRRSTSRVIDSLVKADKGSIIIPRDRDNKENACIVQETGDVHPDFKNWRIQMMEANSRSHHIKVSASSMPSKLGWKMISEEIVKTHSIVKKIIVLDLRQESHGYLNGHAISLATPDNWINLGKNTQQVFEIESVWLESLSQHAPLNVLTPQQFKDQHYKDGKAISDIHIQSEKEVVGEEGFEYYRLAVSDHRSPSDDDVDQFINLVENLQEDTWLHIHCRSGEGRCATFLTMLYMLKHADTFSFEDIIKRQAAIPPYYDLSNTHRKGNLDYTPHYLYRYEFLGKFYHFSQARLKGLSNSWVHWSENTRNVEMCAAAKTIHYFKKSFFGELKQIKKYTECALNIVFLDIDGVMYAGSAHDQEHLLRVKTGEINLVKLHPLVQERIPSHVLETLNDADISKALGFSKLAIANLRELCESFNAKIVLSSSWRDAKNLEKIKGLFSLCDFSEYIIDATPVFLPPYSRGNEIESWLLKNSDKVKSFVILDDNKFNIPQYFGDRLVLCTNIFSDKALLHSALTILDKPLNDENSDDILLWKAIENNSTQLKNVKFDLKKITTLKLYFGWENETLIKNLFKLLEKNSNITHLTLHQFALYSEMDGVKFLNSLMVFLEMGKMNIEYLDISNNEISNFSKLLYVIDGKTKHIPHVCLSANLIANQDKFSEWVASYPKSIQIDLDFSSTHDGHILNEKIIQAVISNENISLCAQRNSLSHIHDEIIKNLVTQGRLTLNDSPPDYQRNLMIK